MSKLSSAIYYANRPSFWPYGIERIRRMLKGAQAYDRYDRAAADWAAKRAVSVEQALRRLAILDEDQAMPPPVDPALLVEGEARASSGVRIGGPGDLALIYALILATGSRRVIETGVAEGWSSLVILEGLRRTGGELVSVDMPYIGERLEAQVGLVVPAWLRDRWTLLRQPDRHGIRKAIRHFRGQIDLCHYDSDKSYPGRAYAYPLLWDSLRCGGVLISDDIQDNFGFRDFTAKIGTDFAITESSGKFVGIIVKPGG